MRKRERCRERGRVRNSYPGNLFNSSFYAPLKNTIVTGRGSSTPTFTRATAAWCFDNEGKLNLNIPSGCARFSGGRLVRNRFTTTSESISAWSTTGTSMPDANTLLATAGSSAHIISRATTGTSAVVGEVYTGQARIGKDTHNLVQLAFFSSVFGTSIHANINLDTGEYNLYGASAIQIDPVSPGIWDVQLYATVTTAGTPQFNIGIPNSMTAARSNSWNAAGTESVKVYRYGFYNVSGESDYLNNEYVSVGVLSSPYHGAGTAAGADGCKWFTTNKDGSAISGSIGYLAEITRANNVRQSRDLGASSTGSASGTKCWNGYAYGSELLTNGDFSGGLTNWTNISTGSGTAALGGGGVQVSGTTSGNRGAIEQLVTGLDPTKLYVLQVNITSFTSGQLSIAAGAASGTGSFDTDYIFANASGIFTRLLRPGATDYYIKVMTSATGGVMTVDDISLKPATINEQTGATGLDNIANSASRLTAMTNDAIIDQFVTAASGSRTLSAYVKRVSGSGTISITRNGGTNWTDITSSLILNTWVRVSMVSDVGANPTVGFKISTSGDVIDVDLVQDENGAWPTSPIYTTTTAITRNSDVLSYANAFDVAQGTALCSLRSDVPINSGSIIYVLQGGTGGSASFVYLNSADARTISRAYDGVNVAIVTSEDITTGIRKKAVRWGTDLVSAGSGILGVVKSFDGSMGASSTLFIGCSSTSVDHLSGTICDVHIWPTPLTDTQLQQVTR